MNDTTPTELPAESAWDRNAAFWTEIIRGRRDRYRTELTDPAVLEAIGDCAGLHVLDAGCGEGYMSREIARRGAASIDGIDQSAALLAAARSDPRPGVTFTEGSVASLPFPAGTFDLALANHLLNDLPDIDGPVSELARVLKPGGRLVALMLHPCFYGHNAEQSPLRQHLPAASYFTQRKVTRPFEVDGLTSPAAATAWLRPLEAYTAAITGSGMHITGLTEPRPSDRQAAASQWWRDNYQRPLLMLITARKS